MGSKEWQTCLLPVSSVSAHTPLSLTKRKFKDKILQNVKTVAEHLNKGRSLPSAGPCMIAKLKPTMLALNPGALL